PVRARFLGTLPGGRRLGGGVFGTPDRCDRRRIPLRRLSRRHGRGLLLRRLPARVDPVGAAPRVPRAGGWRRLVAARGNGRTAARALQRGHAPVERGDRRAAGVRPARHDAAPRRARRLSYLADVSFDRFYRYDELTKALEAWAAEYPKLFRFESIGQSFEGRDIWLATVTNTETGPDDEKPAFLVEANIHSVEVTGTTAALHLLNRLVTGYGEEAKVTRVVDTRTFYVIPRLNPDGAELALADKPKYTRSSVRPW